MLIFHGAEKKKTPRDFILIFLIFVLHCEETCID